jgi:ABC-2 type transport system ATP-binding protein
MKILGYLPGEMAFFDGMTGIRFLKFMAQLHRVKEMNYCYHLIEMFELDASVKIKKMSKGMKQKLGIVSAFMHNPDVLVLDEPTSGLDPLMQRLFLDLIHTEKVKGKTILMSSHNFDEVEKACNRIGIIKQGRLVAIEDVEVLRNSKRKNFEVTFDSAEHARNFSEKINCKSVTLKEKVATVSLSGDINHFIKELSVFPIVDLKSENGSLEDLFMHYYGGK